jgi:hypothetical protein
VAADPLGIIVSALVGDGVGVPVSISCVRGLHPAGVTRGTAGAMLECR